MEKIELKSLRDDAPYSLQTFILQRPTYSGVRKAMDIADMKAGVLWANDYQYANFDYVIFGVNPLINILFASMLEMNGKNALVSTLRMQDAWDYNQLMSLEFQKKIALKFRIDFEFLRYKEVDKRTLTFLNSFFEKMSSRFKKSVFISNSDIAITSDTRKYDENYLFKAQIGDYVDKLPFNDPKIDGEPLYNKMFNLFYKYYCERGNDWRYATDTKIQTKNHRLSGKLDEHAFYHILSPKVLITSHYHPYIQDKELEDKTVFKVVKSTSIEDLEKWIAE